MISSPTSSFANLQMQQKTLFDSRGFPTRKDEKFRYTNFSELAKKEFRSSHGDQICAEANATAQIMPEENLLVFINGCFSLEQSNISQINAECIKTIKSNRLTDDAKFVNELSQQIDVKANPFLSLNLATLTDGVVINLPANSTKLSLHILYYNTAEGITISPHNIIKVGENNDVTIVEEYLGTTANYFVNAVTKITLDKNARIDLFKLQKESLVATHIAQYTIDQAASSEFNFFTQSQGSELTREDVTVNLLEPYAHCVTNGLYQLTGLKQHVDHHVQVNHLASYTHSEMLYKGTIDHQSHAVFNGKIFVAKDVAKVTTKQANHNLLLSTQAQVDTKPEFEIYAHDVQCAHGASVGQMNKEALFFLQSRGIPKDDAFRLLTHAFNADVIDRIPQEAIKQRFQTELKHE